MKTTIDNVSYEGSRCLVCHKPLKDSRSLKRGVGPDCYRRFGNQWDMFSLAPPEYTWSVEAWQGEVILLIIDQWSEDQSCLTVIDGAELVIAEIKRQVDDIPRKIVVQQRDDQYVRLVIRSDGKLANFESYIPPNTHRGLSN